MMCRKLNFIVLNIATIKLFARLIEVPEVSDVLIN